MTQQEKIMESVERMLSTDSTDEFNAICDSLTEAQAYEARLLFLERCDRLLGR